MLYTYWGNVHAILSAQYTQYTHTLLVQVCCSIYTPPNCSLADNLFIGSQAQRLTLSAKFLIWNKKRERKTTIPQLLPYGESNRIRLLLLLSLKTQF